ncbi:long-chain fatty acid transporter [Papiliotrema laurentii]|uniref:Long-chain fatty acid transporter n=1 Tax=Papiliotrema laurentii TaxID=5418 RepID=A0AAD9FSJ1_PAPLA|nr:long-chain fatty acid transporter [Papiliotrema laurentii]
MVNVQKQFDKAVDIVKNLPKDGPIKPSQDQQLEFYAHFKQANEGDNTGAAPSAFNFTAKYKYNAWKKLEGMSKEEAQKKYVELLKSVLEQVNDEESKKYLAELEAAGQE